MATETKSNLVKVKSSGQDGSSRAKFDVAINNKKMDSSSKQPADSKQKSVVTKTEVKSKTSSGSSKTTATTKTKVREKKVYTLPGQKHDPPEEREPLRIFYESLSKQIPTSEMAELWMMEHGLSSPEKARKAYEKKQRRQKQLRAGTPIKPSKPSTKPESSKNEDVKAKKRINNDIGEDEDDFVLSPKRRKGIQLLNQTILSLAMAVNRRPFRQLYQAHGEKHRVSQYHTVRYHRYQECAVGDGLNDLKVVKQPGIGSSQ